LSSEHALSQTKLSVKELKNWLEKETGSILTPVQAQAQRHRDETRVALQNLTEASKMLLDISQKEIEKRNMKVYNRARALNKLATLFMERIKKLKVPDQISFDSFSLFAIETQKTIAVIEIDVRNWFPRISPFFIMDRRKFLTVYEKTKLTVNSLSDFINKEYVKSKTLEKTFQLIAELQTLEQQLGEVESVKDSLQSERLLLEKEIADLDQKIVQLKTNAVLEQVAHLEVETEALNNELKLILRHLQKPFLKMQALATSGGGGGVTPDELKMIGLYMENPFEAIITEQSGCPTLNQILEKLTSLMAEDKLKLKPDKQRKAEQAVTEILKSAALADLHSKSFEVATRKKQLLASTEMEEARRSLTLFQQQMDSLIVRKGNIEADEHSKENQRQELLERIRTFKKTIEANVLSFMGKPVLIQ
jgi:DNA repair exonuclease SbcCD ATPase subunit